MIIENAEVEELCEILPKRSLPVVPPTQIVGPLTPSAAVLTLVEQEAAKSAAPAMPIGHVNVLKHVAPSPGLFDTSAELEKAPAGAVPATNVVVPVPDIEIADLMAGLELAETSEA